MQQSNEVAPNEPYAPVSDDHRALVRRRLLVLGFWLAVLVVIVGGLLLKDELLAALLIVAAFLIMVLCDRSLRRGISLRLRRELDWGLFSIFFRRKPYAVLNEEEKMSVDQAYRCSYKVLVFVGTLLVIVFGALYLSRLNIDLPRNLQLGTFTHLYPVLGLYYGLASLPVTFIAWRRRI